MKKITKEAMNTLLAKITRNPYETHSTAYYIDGQLTYLFNGESYTPQELRLAYLETAAKDIQYGYSDRSAGYYDKWYRYNHMDQGHAYDIGQRYASDKLAGKDPGFTIIECEYARY